MEIKMNKRGVTLLELIIVMVIIGIGATLLAPGIGSWIPIYRLKGATRDVVSMLRTAQMKAVSTNLEYRVYFNAGERMYWIERGNQSSNSTNWVGTTAVDNAAREGNINILPSGVTINFTGFKEFNPNSTSSSGSLTLTNSKGSTREITLTPSTGRIIIKD